MNNWAIICPGPSLKSKHITEINYDHGCLVAVNGAILHHAGILASWWALLDPEVFATCALKDDLRAYAPLATIWTHFNFENGALGHKAWDQKTHDTYKRFTVKIWDHLGIYGKNTFFTAIRLAVTEGARIIRIYGADMCGVGYFEDGFENSKTRHDVKRWVEETDLFDEVVKDCRANGVQVVRC